MEKKEFVGKVKNGSQTIRLRTWTLSVAIIGAIILYFLVQVGFDNEVNFVDLLFLSTIQIVVHFLYFPDGDLFGQKAPVYVSNKNTYNDKATEITENGRVGKLREYCVIEYNRRRQLYIATVCGHIGIEVKDYERLMQLPQEEVKHLKSVETAGKTIYLTKKRRKWLYDLIFEPLPVETNDPETILSATEERFGAAVNDESVHYRKKQNVKRVIQSFVVGTALAYIGYTSRDGITLAVIVKTVVNLVSVFTTAVMSFSRGETCSSVYRNRFYVKLSNFIDGFNEWRKQEEEIKTQTETVVQKAEE